jgi:solute carrier family 40 (iron-regulated transporter), member 1
MRRIDLFCKLVGPLVIALIDGFSTEMAILITLGWNVTSVAIEYYAIAKVPLEDGQSFLLCARLTELGL